MSPLDCPSRLSPVEHEQSFQLLSLPCGLTKHPSGRMQCLRVSGVGTVQERNYGGAKIHLLMHSVMHTEYLCACLCMNICMLTLVPHWLYWQDILGSTLLLKRSFKFKDCHNTVQGCDLIHNKSLIPFPRWWYVRQTDANRVGHWLKRREKRIKRAQKRDLKMDVWP